jgi:hypothetical protein
MLEDARQSQGQVHQPHVKEQQKAHDEERRTRRNRLPTIAEDKVGSDYRDADGDEGE